jgi:hypothetical protein
VLRALALLSALSAAPGCLQDMDPSPAIDAAPAGDAGASQDAPPVDAMIVDAPPPPDADVDAGYDACVDGCPDAMPDAGM